ncbi:MAG: hypothetical protein LBK08_03965, partial [Treponema sp.]|nr:hypothetical protein [Treponema sp.]
MERHSLGDVILAADIRSYVERVVGQMGNDDFAAIQTGYQFYVSHIRQKIESLLADYREVRFYDLLEARDILCRPMFALPKIITP